MRPSIPDEIKTEIVRLWLMGSQRDRIADSLKVSAGTVSHAISEWKNRMGVPLAEEVRDFCVLTRSQNVTPLECAEGFRFLSQLESCGISRLDGMSFVERIHKKCVSSSVAPDLIFKVCKEISSLKEQTSIVDLPEVISKQVEVKRVLESDIVTLKDGKEKLQKEYCNDLNRYRIKQFKLERFEETQKRLQEYKISVDDDLERIVNILDNIGEGEFDIKEIVKELAENKRFKQKLNGLRQEISRSESTLNGIKQQLRWMEKKRAMHEQEISVYNELEKNGIYLSDLIMLENKIFEVSTANEDNNNHPLPIRSAWARFVSDVLIQYDAKLGFERQIQEKREILAKLEQELQPLMSEYSKIRDTYDRAGELFRSGMSPFEFLQIYDIIKASGMEPEGIVQDLVKYGNLTKTIGQLEAKVEKLKSDCDDRLGRVTNLKAEEEGMTNKIVSLKKDQFKAEMDFDRRMKERDIALRRAIKKVGLELDIALQQKRKSIAIMDAEEKHKLDLFKKIDAPLELYPVIAASRGQDVDGESLRTSLIRTLEIVLSRLDPENHGTLIATLQQALGALKSEFIIF
jgi:hypothetical protein